jgi:hypothetical protein
MNRDQATDFLARFPGPVTLYPSRTKWLLVFSCGAAFTAGGIAMVVTGEPRGWFVLIFFGLVTLVALAAMLPGAGSLLLDREGFVVTSMFKPSLVRWRDANGFVSGRLGPAPQKFVLYDYSKTRGKIVADVTASLVGRSATLPDTYRLSADDLARLMQSWRNRAV